MEKLEGVVAGAQGPMELEVRVQLDLHDRGMMAAIQTT